MKSKKIFITGGAGYVGTELTELLLNKGYIVTVYDLLIYGDNLKKHKNLKVIKGDIRDQNKIENSISDHDTIIHLACISNDPSFELNPTLGKEINLDCFEPLVRLSKKKGIKKFIYASSSSVYGIKKNDHVTEDMKLEPLTDYSKFKVDCENILLKYMDKNFFVNILRPATVCGYSKRQRFDLVVNILTNLAYHKREITVYGGNQLRPNITIQDMIRAYNILLDDLDQEYNGKIYNVGFENKTVNKLALDVKYIIGDDVKIKKVSSNDNRSYHISSEKFYRDFNFKPVNTIQSSILELKKAFEKNIFENSLGNSEYFNIKKMQNIKLK